MTNNHDRQNSLLSAKLDQALAQHDLDRRLHQRVAPSAREPVMVVVEGMGLTVRSLSRSGLAFQAGNLADPGWLLPGELVLPGSAHPLPVVMAILTKDKSGMARAQFHDLDEQAGLAIEKYVRRRRQEVLKPGL